MHAARRNQLPAQDVVVGAVLVVQAIISVRICR